MPLALFGGDPLITSDFLRYNSIGEEEVRAVKDVVESGVLSKYIASWSPDFYGGPRVQAFEDQCKEYFGVKHAIAVNSWTSGLICAVGAIGVEPGDEIIVSPWTMSASAMAILHWNAIPVFADIDSETFCIDPDSILKNISTRTRAIMAVDIFGQSADYTRILEIARLHNLVVISDTAQAPGAMTQGEHAGTKAHIGGFSLNYHKHINTGEGGILVTDNEVLADNMRLIRNHAEAVVEDKGHQTLVNMIGFNFRMGEIEAAIGSTQLKKLASLVLRRKNIASSLIAGLKGLPGLLLPITATNNDHVYYKFAMRIDPKITMVDKFTIVDALRAEGVPGVSSKYVNVHLLPVFQRKIAFGSQGFPWNSEFCSREVSYTKGICPIAEKLQDETYIGLDLCEFEISDQEVQLIIASFKKVWSNLKVLRQTLDIEI
jgi:dTDP-4-amino-4,6-dideoxygalactose transaminase